MKSKKQLEEFRELNAEELGTKVIELKEELMRLRFRKSSGQLENTRRVGAVKKDIARARTILKEKSLAA